MPSRFSHCYCHCNNWPYCTTVLNNYCLCCRDSWLCTGFLWSVQSGRNRKGFLLFAVLIGSSCRRTDFVYSTLYRNNLMLTACRNFRNCMGILLLSICCNRSFGVGDLCCRGYCRVLRVVVVAGSKGREVGWCIHYRCLGDRLGYFDSSLRLRRRTCFKKKYKLFITLLFSYKINLAHIWTRSWIMVFFWWMVGEEWSWYLQRPSLYIPTPSNVWWCVLRIIGNDVFMFSDTFSIQAIL